MSDLTDLLELLGFVENPIASYPCEDEEDTNTNYLHEGERILSLARQKKKRKLFKAENLTVRLCNLRYPSLDINPNKACLQIIRAIKNYIKKEARKYEQKESLESDGIPFFNAYLTTLKDIKLSVAAGSYEASLAETVSKSSLNFSLSIATENFFAPCKPSRRFSNMDYFFKINPGRTIHMIHVEDVFYMLFSINWLNQLKQEAESDPSIKETLKYLLKDSTKTLLSYNWKRRGLPEYFQEYLMDNGYTLHNKETYLLSESKITLDYMKKAEDAGYRCLFDLVSLVYGDSMLTADLLISSDRSFSYLYFDSYYENFSLRTLLYFITSLKDLREEEKHRKSLEGIVAKAYMTKRNIPQYILKEMRTSELNNYFGFIEFDEDVDLKLVSYVIEEFKKVNHFIFHDYKSWNTALRFRKLGRHHATGLYYPSIRTMVVDFRHLDSFFHEYFHMLDDTFGDLSMDCKFNPIVARYQALVQQEVTAEEKKGNHLLPGKGKYNLQYYLRKCEIFARCGEIYLFRNRKIISSLLKPEKTKYFCYPDDDELNNLINDYYDNLMIKLDEQTTAKGELPDEEYLYIASH